MNDTPPKGKKRVFAWTIFIFVVIGLAYLCYWWFYDRFYQWTDDAYVSGNMVMVTPQVPGIVTAITAQNTDFVLKGRVLIELDKTDAKISLDRRVADLGEAVRKTMQLFEQAKQYGAMILVKKAEFVKSAQDYEHRKQLIDEGGVSLEDLEHAAAALQASYGELVATEHQFIGAAAQVENTTLATHPLVVSAQNDLRDAFVFLQRCTIEAPVEGVVAQRSVQVGRHVGPGDPLMAVVPLDQMWIDANYKEVQLAKVRVGQPAEVVSDIYGSSVTYRGTVVGIAGGTGSVFSVLPPQNATGNWIKIVQRLPVRINLDPEQIKQFPLRLGLSVETNIDIHDTQKPMFPAVTPPIPIYSTDVFSKQENGAEELIERVMLENLSPLFLEDMKGDE